MKTRTTDQEEVEDESVVADEQVSAVEIPRKNVDESATLEDRLTDNTRHRIGPARYFERDENGDAIESWGGVFDRVASNVAEAEYLNGGDDNDYHIWKHQFESAMRELRFMPNSPTLMNAGLPLQQLSACIAGDAPVYTRDGVKPMASVEVGDEVLTHEGRFKEVTAHWSNGIKETVGLHRGTSRVTEYDVQATPDHEFLNEDDNWVRADSIEDAKAPELPSTVEFPDVMTLVEYDSLLEETKPVTVDNGRVKLQNNPNDDRTATYDQGMNHPYHVIENRDELGWLFGLYLAEGDVQGTDLRFTLSSAEDDIADRLIETMESLFGVPVSISESNHGRWVQYRVSSPFMSDLFASQCGTGTHEKRLPKWVGSAPESYQESILEGLLDGDGHRGTSGDKLVLANPTLVYESTLLARSVGRKANFRADKTRDLSSHQTSKMYSSTSDRTALDNIAREETGRVEVFDMEVKDDHSFVVGDFIVHNCFVLEPKDDMDDINDTQSDAGAIFKSGGGVGYAFHHLRPKGARVSSTGGVSSGPLSFMELYDTTCQTVKQGGKRRGAQMAIMHCQHPDVGRFAVSKRGEDRFSNFNISLGITDDFKEAVENDETITMYDPTTRPSDDHDLRDGEPFEVVPETIHFYDPQWEDAWNDDFDKPGVGLDGKVVEENFWRDYEDKMQTDFSEFRDQIDLNPGEPMELPARFLWQILIDGAHNNGEPGIFYLDETNREHSFDVDEHPEHLIHATNPCSEQPLSEYEACNLGHVNLSLMVDDNAPMFDEFTERFEDKDMETQVEAYLNRALDQDVFRETVTIGTRFLDNVVTMSDFPLDDITDQVRSKRKIGLGLMGFYQMLVQMGVEYGSDVSYEFAREIMRRIDKVSTDTSHELALERGTFEDYEDSKWSNPTLYEDWFEQHAHRDPSDWADGFPVRNHNQTTIAPTGTTSMIGNTTGGCEPLFQVAFLKNVGDDIQGDQNLVEFDDFFLKTLEDNDIDIDAVKAEVKDQMISDDDDFTGVDGLESVPDNIGDLFVTTKDLSGEQHIRMQAAFQEYCDSGISKTLNMPFDSTIDEVGDAFMLALESGIKGTTVYRSGSREEEVKKENVDNYKGDDLDDLSDNDVVEHLVDDRNLSVKAEHTLRNELGVEPDPEDSERTCDECGSGQLDLSEGCPICMSCGYSPCN